MTTLGERAEQALRIAREAPVIAYDTETSGLDWRKQNPIGYVITCPETSIYVPVRHAAGGNLADPNCGPLVEADSVAIRHRFEDELAKAFIDRQVAGHLTIMHNASFDLHFSCNQGIIVGRNCEDTQINEGLLDEYSRSFSLDSCAKAHKVTAKLGDELYAHMAQMFGGTADRNQMGNFWRLPGNDELAVDYAEGDGISTLELRAAQIKLIEEEELSQIHRIESQLIYTVFRMERRGMRASEERIAAVEEEVAKRLQRAVDKLPEKFNVRSASDVRKLMEDSGHTDWPLTEPSSRFPDGQPSFTEKWLKQHDAGKAVIDVRKLTNLGNSFITPLKERHIFKGRVHSSLNQMKSDEFGTISGRFSSSNPNMQQVPKRDKDLGRLFRSIFLPDEGMDFWEMDFSQAEPRTVAHYSKDEALLKGYSEIPYKDIHTLTAELLQVERDPRGKRMAMGLLTGMGPKALAGHMSYSLAEATKAYNDWFNGFPGVKDFQDTATRVFRNRGYVKTILGRKCRLDNPRFAYRAFSRIIQGSGADIIKLKILEIDQMLEAEGDKSHLLCTIHDSIELQCPLGSDDADRIKIMFGSVQEPPYNLRVPFVVDAGHGPDWGCATYGEAK